ncbi:MAG: cyclic nucleotide-binding domain-containing protein [Leptospirales bacterium]|nr:cyclic nucleotide-binding domain-containing protein [Leptospirales bacterium]
MEKVTSLLQKIYLFKDMSPQEVDRIARLIEEKSVSSGQTIFYQGEEPQAIYFVALGTMRLVGKDEDRDYGILGSGAHFGELPFLDGQPHTFTVRAAEPGALFVLSYERLRKLLEHEPAIASSFYRSVAHYLSTRLRAVTSDLMFAREQYQALHDRHH